MPLKTANPYFFVGISIFAVSFTAYIMSLVNYATGNPEKPVTKGIYKISRNPQQISTIFMWAGIGLITGCGLVITLCALQLITVYPTFKAQETFCLEIYGNDYLEYMKQVPRYFLFL